MPAVINASPSTLLSPSHAELRISSTSRAFPPVPPLPVPCSRSAMVELDLPIILQKMEVIDLPTVAAMEERSYPDDEAASRKVLDYRVNYANHLCYIAHHKDHNSIIGFVLATGATSDTRSMKDDNIRNHYQGNVLCIHSVVVDAPFRRRGYATFMLKAYLQKIKQNTDMVRALLLSKKYLLPFYESVGFKQVSVSGITHGKDPWIEMDYHFERPTTS